jgi:hypothetical protein
MEAVATSSVPARSQSTQSATKTLGGLSLGVREGEAGILKLDKRLSERLSLPHVAERHFKRTFDRCDAFLRDDEPLAGQLLHQLGKALARQFTDEIPRGTLTSSKDNSGVSESSSPILSRFRAPVNPLAPAVSTTMMRSAH